MNPRFFSPLPASLGAPLALLLLSFSLVIDVTALGSTFVSQLDHSSPSWNLTLSITIPNPNSTDLFYYFSAPTTYMWSAFGFGTGMSSSLMFIFYPNSDGTNFTISPRISNGYNEPVYNKTIDHTLEVGSGISDGSIIVRGRCGNCMSWPHDGKIDITSKEQPMLYALGPDESDLKDNSPTADLRRHEHYGQFSIDLSAAQGDPQAFLTAETDAFNSSGTKDINGGYQSEHEDYKSAAHAIFAAGVFLVVFPFGTAYRRLSGVRQHWVMQSVGVLGLLVGIGVAIPLSKQYNKSKDFNSAHQLIGLAVLIMILIQASLGTLHHRIYKKQHQSTVFATVHKILGPVAIVLGLVDGILGFQFANSLRHAISYIIFIIIMGLLIAACFYWKSRRERRKGVYNTPAAQNFQSTGSGGEGNGFVARENQGAMPLDERPPPPPYLGGQGQQDGAASRYS